MIRENEYKILDEYLELSLFADVELGLAAAQKIDEAMEHVMEKIGEMLSPLSWSLILYDSQRDVLFFKKTKGKSANRLEGKDIPKRKGLASWIFKNAKPLLVIDVSKESKFHPYINKLTGFKARSVLGIPLKVKENVIGIIELIDKTTKERFGESDLKILQTITDYAVLAVEKIYYLGAIENMSRIEPLTGLLNPRHFVKVAERESERCKRYGRPLTLMTLSIENLEEIHRKNGSEFRDTMLKNLADILKNNIRKIDTPCRYKENEFFVLMPNTKKHEAENVRQRIIKLSKKKSDKKKKKQVPYDLDIELKSVDSKNVSELQEMISKEFNLGDKKKKKPLKKS
ncbi:MAG: diguanylate cyclase [Candidatus Aminicenantes bacterium]|nr:diguanylate cyclase [Candidatus Aminicenantes bacterium]